MKSFDDRRAGFEAAYKHDEELAFRITARRNRLFGLWAAERMGLAEAEAYARSVVVADLEMPGDDDVIEKVRADLAAKGITHGDAELRAALALATLEARAQLAAA